MSRDQKEHLLVLLQENLDGGPFVKDIPDLPGDAVDDAEKPWKETIARRIDEMFEGRVEEIDAQGSAHRLLNRMLRKYSQ